MRSTAWLDSQPSLKSLSLCVCVVCHISPFVLLHFTTNLLILLINQTVCMHSAPESITSQLPFVGKEKAQNSALELLGLNAACCAG